jgi:hypothetical protein
MTETSKINVKREGQYPDYLRKYKIVLDGKELDTLSRGEEKEFEINPGKHKIQLKIDWCKSNIIEFETKKNEKLKFLCGSNLKGLKLFLGLLYATIWRNEYLYIEQEE